MENQDERTNRKMFAVMAVAFVLVIAAFTAYYLGLIPGIGQGSKVAKDLQIKVEASKGPNLKTNLLAYVASNPKITQEQKDLLKTVSENAEMDFQFAGTKASSGEGVGTVEIDAPKLLVTVKSADGAPQNGEVSVPKLFISRDVSNNNHFFYHTEGDVDFSTNMTGTMAKLFSISAEQPINEIKFNNDGYTGYFKSNSKNVKLIEGRGNTVLATIAESNLEGNSNFTDGKIDGYAKISEKNIVPGDMIKIMLGAIEPISLNFDYSYKGDDYRPALNSFRAYTAAQSDERMKAMLDPKYQPKTLTPDIKPIDGIIKVNDISILMGNSGLVLNGDVEFKRSNATAMPFGNLTLKISQYQKLIDYFSRFLKVPKNEIDKSVQMASEIGKNENGDITFNISFDGTENVKVNGKTSAEVKAVMAKYAPSPAPLDVPISSAPAPVTSQPVAPLAAKTVKK